MVTPNGTIVYVNNNSYPDIYFGLKGGFNNFGIVTKFNMRALPQTLVYGGVLIYLVLQFGQVREAIVNFQNNNKDPKAQIIPTILYVDGLVNYNVAIFYDAPTAPNNIFKEFTDILPLGNLQTRTYVSLIKAAPVFVTSNVR